MSLRRSARVQALSTSTDSLNEPSQDAKPSSAMPKAKTTKPSSAARNRSTAKPTATSHPESSATIPDPTSAFAAPETPRKKRKTEGSPAKAPLITPTPSTVGLMAAPSTPTKSSSAAAAALPPRPAEPHQTNAPLKTPRGSRVVAYPPIFDGPEGGAAEGDATPVHNGILPRPTATTENLLEQACAHLISVDPRLKTLIEKHPCKMFSPEGLQESVDPFQALASGIMAQQVSGAAASSIKNKFIALFNPPAFPTPAQVAAADLAVLRTAGLSGRKAEYIKGLAEKFDSGELSARMLVEASYEEVLEKLTAVRGLGQWSVEMFACFGLKRMDVFSTGDLGVQRGMAAYMGKDVSKLKAKGGGKWKYMSEKDMLEVSAKFAPYRSLFMWYMWRIEDVNIDAMQ